jgi:hypothetical protein
MEWIRIYDITEVPNATKLLVWIQPENKDIPGYSDIGMVMFKKWKLVTNKHMKQNVTHYIEIDLSNSPRGE